MDQGLVVLVLWEEVVRFWPVGRRVDRGRGDVVWGCGAGGMGRWLQRWCTPCGIGRVEVVGESGYRVWWVCSGCGPGSEKP